MSSAGCPRLRVDTGVPCPVTPEVPRRRVTHLGLPAGIPLAVGPAGVDGASSVPGGKRYETPEWILQGYEWQTLPLMDEIHREFNEESGTDSQFLLRPSEEL